MRAANRDDGDFGEQGSKLAAARGRFAIRFSGCHVAVFGTMIDVALPGQHSRKRRSTAGRARDDLAVIEVFVEYTGQDGVRTMVPGGPFPDMKSAHRALLGFALVRHGGFRKLIALIDAFGFVGESGTSSPDTKPRT